MPEPKTKKTPGYLVEIKAFVPMDLTDIEGFAALQKMFGDAKSKIGSDAAGSITPTRR